MNDEFIENDANSVNIGNKLANAVFGARATKTVVPGNALPEEIKSLLREFSKLPSDEVSGWGGVLAQIGQIDGQLTDVQMALCELYECMQSEA